MSMTIYDSKLYVVGLGVAMRFTRRLLALTVYDVIYSLIHLVVIVTVCL